jgi:hypothetical protein
MGGGGDPRGKFIESVRNSPPSQPEYTMTGPSVKYFMDENQVKNIKSRKNTAPNLAMWKAPMINIALVAALTITAMFSGCTSMERLGEFTILSSRSLELSRADEYVNSTTQVTGTDVSRWLFGKELLAVKVDLKAAVDDALSKIPGAVAVVDPRLTLKHFRIPFIIGNIYRSETYSVIGTALIDPKRVN